MPKPQGGAGLLSTSLDSLIHPCVKSRLLSHVFIGFGSTTEPTPSFTYEILPGNRTVFDLASLTKALVTVPLVYREILQGRATWDASISSWLGKQADMFAKPLQGLRIKDLVSHRSGLPAWRNLWLRGLCESGMFGSRRFFVQELNRYSREVQAGHCYAYSDLGYILLGLALEEKYGESLATLFKQFSASDLGLGESSLSYPTELSERSGMVPTAYCRVRRRWLVGEVHDENAFAKDGPCGHAGLFGSGRNLHRYLSGLLASEVGAMMSGLSPSKETDTGSNFLGWARQENTDLVGHLGFTGTAFWLSQEKKRIAVILTNRVVSSRTSSWIKEFRSKVMSALWRFDTGG